MRDIKRKIQYNKERYYWFREHKMCGKCGNQDAYTLIGKAYCYECSGKYNCNRPYQYNSQKQKERYNKRKENGICVKCGAKEAREGKTTCASCQAHCSQWRSNKCLTKKSKNNTCSRCAEELDGQINVYGGKSKLCSKCYEETQKYLEIAWNVNSKIKERNKSIMNTQEIIEGYTKANTKSNYINKTAKSLKKPKSHIIAELFKSGYKYIELQRSFPNEYATAKKIYQKWLDEGEQEVIQPDQEEQTEELTEEEKLKAENEKVWKENQELKNKLAESEKNLIAAHDRIQVESQKHKNELNEEKKISFTLLTENEKLEEQILQNAERIRGLEAEVEEAIAEKTKAEEMRDENLRLLQIRDRELAEVRAEKDNILAEKAELRKKVEELETRLAAEQNESLDSLEEMDNELNNCEACMQGILGENQQYQREIEILKEDIETLTKMYTKECKKRKKIQKAFIKAVTK